MQTMATGVTNHVSDHPQDRRTALQNDGCINSHTIWLQTHLGVACINVQFPQSFLRAAKGVPIERPPRLSVRMASAQRVGRTSPSSSGSSPGARRAAAAWGRHA